MPKVKLGKPDYGKKLVGGLRGAVEESLTDWNFIAQKTDMSIQSMRNWQKEPEMIRLGWLKMFIKLTNLNPNVILNYLYDGKYHVKTED